jgi:TetR/AcrR family fatty acid metabolism transcriptional regulator
MEKRALIMQAAVAVFSKKGYPRGRVSDIAKEAKISYGQVYNYFRNKEHILLLLFRERWQRFIDYIERTRSQEIPPSLKLQKVGNFLIRSYEREPDLMKVLTIYVVPHSPFFQKNRGAVEQAFRLIGKIYEEGQRTGDFDPSLNPQIAALGFYGGILQILLGWIQGILPSSPAEVAKAYRFIQYSSESSKAAKGAAQRRPNP